MMMHAERVTIASRLAEVSAALRPGGITAICGPNGAGKSTLLQVLAGLLVPDSGLVTLDGALLSHLHPRERARRIGYLPQEGRVVWDVSVRNLVALGRLPHRGASDNDAAIDRAMDALELHALADRPASRLSGGERARVLLGRVLAGEPDWILADEPLAALDLAHQLALLAHLKVQAARGIGIALVLHDLALAMNHADRVLVLDEGRLAADGAPEIALSSEVIGRVWHVEADWLGEPGARALTAR